MSPELFAGARGYAPYASNRESEGAGGVEPLRVLVACEYSGAVRDAFRALGFGRRAREWTLVAVVAPLRPARGAIVSACPHNGNDFDPGLTVDLYGAGTLWKQRVWNTGPLALGPHNLTIEWTGTKSVSTGGTNINVDAFEVLGNLD